MEPEKVNLEPTLLGFAGPVLDNVKVSVAGN
jgi:hypothetical protein